MMQPGSFRLPQQAAQPCEEFLLGAERLLPLAQALGVRAIPNIALWYASGQVIYPTPKSQNMVCT